MIAPLHAAAFCYGLAEPDDSLSRSAWLHWIAPLGLGLGVALALLMALGWQTLHLSMGGYGLWMAVVPVLGLYLLGPGAGRLLAFARLLAHLRQGQRLPDADTPRASDPLTAGLGAMAMLAAAGLFYVAIATLPTDAPTHSRLPYWIAMVIRPRKVYAAIVLMGLWGNGAMFLAAMMGRPGRDASTSVRQLLAAPLWVKFLWGWLTPTAGSVVLFSGWWSGGWASALALGVMLFGLLMLTSWLLARMGQGHGRETLLGSAVLAEIGLLIIFHAMT
jgi:hypothetical protein